MRRERKISLLHMAVLWAMGLFNFSRAFLSTPFFNRRIVHPFSLKSLSSMTSSPDSVALIIDTPETMEEVGSFLSIITQPGDVIFLDGDIGAGKSVFARGFIRTRTGISDLRVTSPTYLLCNTYPTYDNTPM